jgi:hypothetical protein
VAEPPAPAASDFCFDEPLPCVTACLGTAPPLSLATLLAVYRDQTAAAPEQRDADTGHARRFWVPVYADDEARPRRLPKDPREAATAGADDGSENGSENGSEGSGSVPSAAERAQAAEKWGVPKDAPSQRRPPLRLLRPHELADEAARSRRVLGMWVEVTTRTRPAHLPPKRSVAQLSANQRNLSSSTIAEELDSDDGTPHVVIGRRRGDSKRGGIASATRLEYRLRSGGDT